jgi:hypothetical protein
MVQILQLAIRATVGVTLLIALLAGVLLLAHHPQAALSLLIRAGASAALGIVQYYCLRQLRKEKR